MVLNIDNTENKAFKQYKKALPVDPSVLMLPLADQDKRLYFAYCITRKTFLYTNAAFNSFFSAQRDLLPETFLNYVHPTCAVYLKKCFAELQPGVAKHNIEFSLNLPGKKGCRLRLSLIYHTNTSSESALTGYAEEIPAQPVRQVVEDYQHKKKTMLNILSHDLLSPMGSIHNLAALLSRKNVSQHDPEVHKWISMIGNISKKSIATIRSFVAKEFTQPGISAAKKERI